jgi:hypothetical protein
VIDSRADAGTAWLCCAKEVVVVYAIVSEKVRETVSVTLFNRSGKPVQQQGEVHRVVPF